MTYMYGTFETALPAMCRWVAQIDYRIADEAEDVTLTLNFNDFSELDAVLATFPDQDIISEIMIFGINEARPGLTLREVIQ